MASQIILKNGQDQEFSITHPDNVGAININSNELVSKDYLTTTIQPTLTGTATFTATDNKIVMTGIVTALRLEIGDVIQISGADDAKNNSEFTIEVIIDDNNVIVNQAHANKGTTKNVANRSGDTNVTIKMLSKYYNAPLGLGQGWVDVKSSRQLNTTYTNSTGRSIQLAIPGHFSNGSYDFYINGERLDAISSGTNYWTFKQADIIPAGYTYRLTGANIYVNWSELR